VNSSRDKVHVEKDMRQQHQQHPPNPLPRQRPQSPTPPQPDVDDDDDEDMNPAKRPRFDSAVSNASPNRVIPVKGAKIGENFTDFVNNQYSISYKKQDGGIIIPELINGSMMMRCSKHAVTSKGIHTHCELSSFQIKSVAGRNINTYTQCEKGRANSNSTNAVRTPESRAEEYAKKSDERLRLRQQELQVLIDQGVPIEENWSEGQDERKARDLLAQEPLRSLTQPNSQGVFYPYFALSSRMEIESTAFLTERGGRSKKRRTRGQDRKTSRPILMKTNGSVIRPQELWNAGFQKCTLFEMRNWSNVAALERRLQTIIARELNIHIGRRLFRDYFGGGKPVEDGDRLKYGLYLTYHLKYEQTFVLNV